MANRSLIAQISEIINNKEPRLALASYHAAREVRNANRRIGVVRRASAMRKALYRFNVTITYDETGTVRLYSPELNKEMFLEP